MTLRILHDVHLGAMRSAGTTPETQWALRQHLQDGFAALLPTDQDLMLLGDLFDTHNVPLADVLQALKTLMRWLDDNPSSKLFNVYGNHDASKTSNLLSSFQFIGRILSELYPDRYIHIEKPTAIAYGYVVPHMVNQSQFDVALSQVPEVPYLFVHCNYNNHFAAQSDQSLNISEEQAGASKAKKIVFAHEHHGRDLGKVLVPGNQIASSVSDWLQQTDKRFLTIRDDSTSFYTVANKRADEFAEVGYADLAAYEGNAKFIRVVGATAAKDTSAVLTAINKFRRTSDALVIANAVQIETEGEVIQFDTVLKNAESFSVMAALKPYFTEPEYKVLESLAPRV